MDSEEGNEKSQRVEELPVGEQSSAGDARAQGRKPRMTVPQQMTVQPLLEELQQETLSHT